MITFCSVEKEEKAIGSMACTRPASAILFGRTPGRLAIAAEYRPRCGLAGIWPLRSAGRRAFLRPLQVDSFAAPLASAFEEERERNVILVEAPHFKPVNMGSVR